MRSALFHTATVDRTQEHATVSPLGRYQVPVRHDTIVCMALPMCPCGSALAPQPCVGCQTMLVEHADQLGSRVGRPDHLNTASALLLRMPLAWRGHPQASQMRHNYNRHVAA